MLTFLILLPFSILILNIWIWVFSRIFNIYRNNTMLIIISLAMWLISWLSILIYPTVLWFLWFEQFDFTKLNSSTSISIFNLQNFYTVLFFRLYLSVFIIIIKISLSWFKFTKNFLLSFVIFSFLFIISWLIWNKIISQWFYLYYIFVAFWEEYIKYFLWVNFYERFKLIKSDIIIFIILSAIWFAFIENLVYMSSWMSWKVWMIWLVAGTSVLITRWIVWFIIHILFTWNIWLISEKWFSWNSNNDLVIFIWLWIIVWTFLHYFYNLLLHLSFNFIIVVFLLFWYFWVSYLFYRADRIYVNDKVKL